MKILAIDPGREKCGLAVVNGSGEAIFLAIVPTTNLASSLKGILGADPIEYIALGDGTNNNDIFLTIKKINSQIKIIIVDEKNTTYDARELYWRKNPPTGWQKLLPLGLRNISKPIDDYAAWLIGKKSLTEIN